MSKKMFFRAILSFFVIFLLIAGPLHAVGNIHYGQIQIDPYFNLRQEYRSNIYLTADNETDDFITFFTPGVRFYLPNPNGDAELDYHADLLSYWDDDKNNTQRQFLNFKGDWQIGKQYNFLLEDMFESTDDPATSELTSRESRIRNRFNTAFSWQGRRTGVEGGFTSIRDDYELSNQLDRIENFFTVIGSYRIFPKTNGIIQYRYGEIKYDEKTLKRDSSYHEVTAGASGTFSPRVTGELRAGFQWRDYEDILKKDFNGAVIYASITHQLNPRVQTTVALEKGVQEATFAASNYYNYIRFGLNYRHMMGRKQILKAGIGYERDDFPQATRADNIWDLILGWDYNIQPWITTGIGYRFRNRESSFVPVDYDYADHIIDLHGNLAF
ncbi:MAG: outer membrane beta-barrel protein [Candidatus Omnitrophica bacterium]|nr:outer membrane beta-barrel protein [Candidatus Omnitrophota bacterium]